MYAKIKKYREKVVIYYYNDGNVLRYPTNISIENPRAFRKGEFTDFDTDYLRKNETITVILNAVEDIILDHIKETGFKPPVEYLKNELKKKKSYMTKKYSNIFEYYFEFLDDKKKSGLRKGTIKDYNSLLNSLVLYAHVEHELSIYEINSNDFIRDFEHFLSKKHDVDKKIYKTEGSLNHNTLKKRISRLKTFLRWLDEKGVIEFNKNIEKRISVYKNYIPTIVRLDEDEIRRFEDTRVEIGKEQKVKDILLFACYTGLRYSDIISLSKFDVVNGSISKTAVKTSEAFSVPLIPKAKKILIKYNYNLKLYSNQKFNEYIKEVLKKYKICNKTIRITEHRENEVHYIYIKKYNKITSHTGRRTFISRCVELNVPINKIMQCTGHKNMKTLLHYIDTFGGNEKKTATLLTNI